jgi:hypothetical protein
MFRSVLFWRCRRMRTPAAVSARRAPEISLALCQLGSEVEVLIHHRSSPRLETLYVLAGRKWFGGELNGQSP